MADADSDLENEFPFNIYSPIDPRFTTFNAYFTKTANEGTSSTVTAESQEFKEENQADLRTPAEDGTFANFNMSPGFGDRQRLDSHSSIVDGLLSEIYDRWQDHRHDSFDSDTFTECSSTSEFMHWRRHSVLLEIAGRQLGHLHRGNLQDYGAKDLKNILFEISRHVNQMSARLVRQLKRRERRMSKLQNNCDIVTAIIQASSPKRRIDTRMKFSVEPCGSDSAFEQWKDAMKAVARLPLGIPAEFRKKVWLSLADHHIKEVKIDWDKTIRFAFNERSNPDDNKLGLQIVKDLHRTGCSGFSGEDNEEERALLKRILLAYARWNKVVGYCQGFNMIAALLLEVMDRKESDALKVMIYLIDHVLPQGYFANNLRALSVDMAVFRDLLKIFPKLSRHLDYLQHAQDQTSGGCYEPPLTNVFTMQWFLTLFATCLPKTTVLRVWDSILLDGSEILLRTALVIWGKLSSRILTVSSADEFYTLMGDITQEMLEGNILDADSMIKSIYSIAPFPLPQLTELREKYTYNIRPFTPASKRSTWTEGAVLPSDEDDLEEEDLENISCFTGFIPTNVTASMKHHKGLEGDQRTSSLPDISSLGPGAYGMGPADGSGGVPNVPAYMERMTTDISALKKQYTKLRQRQNQAHVILAAATARHQAMKSKPMMPTIETPTAMNHLFLNKYSTKGRNRFIAEGPRIANVYPIMEPYALTKQSKQSRNKNSQSVAESKQKWKPKAKSEKMSEEKAEVHSSHSQIKTQKVGGDQKVPGESTDQSVNKAIGISCVEDTKVPARVREESEHAADKVADADYKEYHIPDNVHKRLQHTDSGIGYSVSSPMFSGSSTENSPQHSRLSGNDSDGMPQCEKTNASEKLTSRKNPVSENENVEDYTNHINDLTNIVKEINETQSVDLSENEKVSGHMATDRHKKYKNIDEELTECDKEISIDPCENEEVNCERNVQIVSGSEENVSKAVNGSGDSGIDNGAENVTTDTAGASGDTENREQIKGAKDENIIESPLGIDCKGTEPESADETKQQINVEDRTNEFCGDGKAVLEPPSQRKSSSPNSSLTLCPSDSSKGLSVGRSSSSNSAISVHSGEESDSYPEVFSPGSTPGQASFQQYYINKKNLSTESAKGLDTQLRKTNLPKKAFNPFPVKHMNQNRARTGIKLGLYTPSTLQEYERSLKGQPVWGK